MKSLQSLKLVLMATATVLTGCALNISNVKFEERATDPPGRFRIIRAEQSVCEVERQLVLFSDENRQLWLGCPYRYENKTVPLVAFVGPQVQRGAAEFTYDKATAKMATLKKESLRPCGKNRYCADLGAYGYMDFTVELANRKARVSYLDLSSGFKDVDQFYAQLNDSATVQPLDPQLARLVQPVQLVQRIERLGSMAQLRQVSEQLTLLGLSDAGGVRPALEARRAALELPELRQLRSFVGFQSAYRLSGDRSDLESMQKLATTAEQKSMVFAGLLQNYGRTPQAETLLAAEEFAATPSEKAELAKLKLTAEQEQQAERRRQDELAKRAEDKRLGRLQCTVPRPTSTPAVAEEGQLFWGECDSSDRGITGVVVSTYNGVPTSLRCLSNGSYSDKLGEFDACNAQWAKVPSYCAAGDYKGQCDNGVANGVGVRYRITYARTEVRGVLGIFAGMARPQEAHEIARGMFKDGKLDGFGNFFSISGCGMAGCSGDRTNQTGWFEKDQLKFECATVQACAAKLSGAAFTSRLKPHDTAATRAARANEAPATTFAEAIGRFERSGSIDDLKAARALAKTPAEHAVLELNILRTAGYEKGLAVTARLVQGDRSVTIEDSQRLLGFYRSVDSGMPLKLQWQISPNPSAAPLRVGTYRVRLRLGVVVKSTTRTCVGDFCNNRDDARTVAQPVDAVLTASKAYRAAGELTLMAPGASTSMTFGVGSLKDVKSTEPLVSIDSVELAP